MLRRHNSPFFSCSMISVDSHVRWSVTDDWPCRETAILCSVFLFVFVSYNCLCRSTPYSRFLRISETTAYLWQLWFWSLLHNKLTRKQHSCLSVRPVGSMTRTCKKNGLGQSVEGLLVTLYQRFCSRTTGSGKMLIITPKK